MAQALFDEHPLEQYLREAGEAPELMPGGVVEFVLQHESGPDVSLEEDREVTENAQGPPSSILKALDILRSILSAAHQSSHPSPFVERFKYDVISSSLLSSSLSAPHHGRRPSSPALPGKLRMGHSRTSSAEHGQHSRNMTTIPHPIVYPSHGVAAESHWLPSLAFVLVASFFSSGHYILAALSLGGTLNYMQSFKPDGISKPDMTPSLETLNDLVAASDVWESVVQEAITILESEERSIFYGSTTPFSPSSSLRVALHSSLHTTQTQCDNVRQLFSALTSPSELSQLSEMYAPPSPMKPNFDHSFSSDGHPPRPLSLPGAGPSSRKRTTSVPTDPGTKRATWNGSYSSLALAGSPTRQVLQRREKRRSDLSALSPLASPPKSASAPVTPLGGTSSLSGVQEEVGDVLDVPSVEEASHFGIAALDLRRKRKSSGMEAFGIPPPSYFSTPSPGPRSPGPSTIASGSRFTTMQTTRHPLSLSAVNNALQGALASKRYACSHLLALRFADEDDEGYWEDVRSVMGLLMTTFVDASSRLTDALDEAERKKLRDETPTPDLKPSRPGSLSPTFDVERKSTVTSTMEQMSSFAPMPSHLSRFASHVDAISSALNDAREHLEDCVASLREVPMMRRQRSSSSSLPEDGQTSPQEPPALQAYERLRRELGLALRECERGRERLLDIVSPPVPLGDPDYGESDDLPGLGHDAGSDSDKPDSNSPMDDDSDPNQAIGFSVVPPDTSEGAVGTGDDATSHLLLTASSQHLPPPGVEQVFESETGSGVLFTRERSKLNRAERIQLVKARRESGGGLGLGIAMSSEPEEPGAKVEKWGPSGEVVQELKDVIWKVSERRRRMTSDGQLHSVVPNVGLSEGSSTL